MENKNKNQGFDFDDNEEKDEIDDYRPEYSDEKPDSSGFDLEEEVDINDEGEEDK